MHDRPTVTASRIVHETPWMRLREDTLVWPDGTPGSYSVVEKAPSAIVAAVEDGHVWLVEQFRHPIGRRTWELPQGTLDDRPGAPPEEVARTELAEETGLRAEHLRHLGRLCFVPGLSAQAFDGWLATGLTRGEQALDATEQGLVVARVPLAELPALQASGALVDAPTVAVLALAGLWPAGP